MDPDKLIAVMLEICALGPVPTPQSTRRPTHLELLAEILSLGRAKTLRSDRLIEQFRENAPIREMRALHFYEIRPAIQSVRNVYAAERDRQDRADDAETADFITEERRKWLDCWHAIVTSAYSQEDIEIATYGWRDAVDQWVNDFRAGKPTPRAMIAKIGIGTVREIVANEVDDFRRQNSQEPDDDEILDPIDAAILNALDGRALKVEPLADLATGGDTGRLYKGERLKRLVSRKLIAHKHGVGYYRPDKPPPHLLPPSKLSRAKRKTIGEK